MQFLYRDGDIFHFMNTATLRAGAHHAGNARRSGAVPAARSAHPRRDVYEGEPVGIELPLTVD